MHGMSYDDHPMQILYTTFFTNVNDIPDTKEIDTNHFLDTMELLDTTNNNMNDWNENEDDTNEMETNSNDTNGNGEGHAPRMLSLTKNENHIKENKVVAARTRPTRWMRSCTKKEELCRHRFVIVLAMVFHIHI